jgi:hypothetical protein
MIEPIQLDFDFSSALTANYSAHSGTCISHQVKELDDVYQNFGGLPDSYCLANTTLHQLWWTRAQLDYDQLEKLLTMEIVSISSIRQDPGNTIPYHRDMFHKISQLYPNRSEKKVRANIFLEDAKLGHMFQYTLNNKHQTATDWKANTGFLFDSEVLHLSCNAGMEPKYTLQISGFYLGQEQ